MKSLSTRLLVMLFVFTLLAAGCAKKPAGDEGVGDETPQISVDDEQPVSFSEENVNEGSGYDSAADSAAEAAAAARPGACF